MTSTSGKVTGAGGRGFSAEIRIEGLEDTIGALRALEPDVLKALRSEIKEAIRDVGREASSAGPPGHSLKYYVRDSIRGKRVGARLGADDRDTSIFEFAGTRMRSRAGGPITPQGAAMVRWLEGFGSPGRFMWAAWDRRRSVFEAELKAAIGRAERTLQDRLDRAGEVF